MPKDLQSAGVVKHLVLIAIKRQFVDSFDSVTFADLQWVVSVSSHNIFVFVV
jgi:hypothetical protein